MRRAPPTGCSTVWRHLRRFPHARIWSTRWPRRRCRPNCPGHGQTAPLVGWRSWCDEPVYHQHHLHRTQKRQRSLHTVHVYVNIYRNRQRLRFSFSYSHFHSSKVAAAHTRITAQSLRKQPHSCFPPLNELSRQLITATLTPSTHGSILQNASS